MEETPWYKKPAAWIAAIISVLLAIIFGLKKRAENDEGQLASVDTRIRDAALAEKQKALEAERAASLSEIQRLEEAKKALGKTELTPEEVKKFWDNK